ncbi:SDR family NAD(P)-dependent oxidoreductase [Sphingosinithalassobacter portus]|uniref:SDR family NAD(P)-dependent oxidoreductase n=1 Tax=Stakelama portus TaxID=2676234 RepID=UPI001EFC8BBC|nr:SDR family NAD(P)-dependent oxidoreductase [Sphingosinithalassobacter portus]
MAPESNQPLAGQVALVTGASSGLGRQFAVALAAAGASVAVAARRTDRLDELVAELRKAGASAMAVGLDIADAAAIPGAVDAVERELGAVSILVNNAGIARAKPAVNQLVDEIDAMLAVNVRGPFVLAAEVGRRLIDAGKPGRIINIASIGAFNYDGKIPCAMYVATKSAVVRMTEALSVEWAKHGINVNAIAPGFFRSEMSGPSIAKRGEEFFNSRQPRGRIGEPPMLDSTLVYLASPASEAVTGTCIKVDDGQMPR